ncbi:sperm-associated antigen 5-like isoform X2 [Limulus polyphemus]|uniref:Sperm-associated antigen 5-like isoform X2 n=1 Tax=Limulus polyphemus TaxID=6850 RepID=A0ABM1C4Y7_LIMPO|nr:sperm-associated antigen 5-like isoform X2 [Limulus polyphemus]
MATDQQQLKPTATNSSPFSRSKSLRLPSRKKQNDYSINSLTRHGSIRLPKSATSSNTSANNDQGTAASKKKLKPLYVFHKPIPPPKPKLNIVSINKSVHDGKTSNRASKMACNRAISAEDLRKQVNNVSVKVVEESSMNISTCSLPAKTPDSCSVSPTSRGSPNSIRSERIYSLRGDMTQGAKETQDLKPHLKRLTEEHEKLQMEYARLRIQHIELATAHSFGSPSSKKDFPGASTLSNFDIKQTKQEICERENRLKEQLKEQENLITGYRDEVVRLQGEARLFQRKYWQQVMSCGTSEVELEDALQQIACLIEKLEDKQKELNQANIKIQQLEEQLCSCDRELQQCRDAIDDYQSQLEGAEAQNVLLRCQIKDLEGDLAEGRDSLEFLQVERSTLTETIQELEQTLLLAREKANQDKAYIDELKDRCQCLYDKIQDKELQNQVLQAQISATEGQAQDLLLSQGAELSTIALALTQLGYHAHALLTTIVEYAGNDLQLNQEVLDEIISDAEDTDSDASVKHPEETENNEADHNFKFKEKKLKQPSDERCGDIKKEIVIAKPVTNFPSNASQKQKPGSFVWSVIQAFEGTKGQSDLHSSTNSLKETSPKLYQKIYKTHAVSHQEEKTTRLLNGETDQICDEQLLFKDVGIPDRKIPGSAFRPIGLASPFCSTSVKPQQNGLQTDLNKLQHEAVVEDCNASKQPRSGSLESIVKKVNQLFQKMAKMIELMHEKYKTQLFAVLEENKCLKKKVQFLEEKQDQLQKEVEAKDDVLEHTTAKLEEISEKQKEELESHQKEMDLLQKQVEQMWEKNHCLEAVNIEQSRQIKEEIKKTYETAPQQMGMESMVNALTICDKLALKQEIVCLKKALETKGELLHNMDDKYARNKEVWEDNCRKAEMEIQMLDDIIYQCIDTLQSIPEVVNSCESLRKLMTLLNGGSASYNPSAISFNKRDNPFSQTRMTV